MNLPDHLLEDPVLAAMQVATDQADTPERQELLEAIFADSGRDLQAALEDAADHSALLEGDFGASVLILSISQNSIETLRAWRHWGFSSQSLLYDKPSLTLGMWCALNIPHTDNGRIDELIRGKWLDPWDCQPFSTTSNLNVGDVALCRAPHFSRWLKDWSNHLQSERSGTSMWDEHTRTRLPAAIIYMLRVLHTPDAALPEASPPPAERLARMLDSWSAVAFPGIPAQDVWMKLVQNPPHGDVTVKAIETMVQHFFPSKISDDHPLINQPSRLVEKGETHTLRWADALIRSSWPLPGLLMMMPPLVTNLSNTHPASPAVMLWSTATDRIKKESPDLYAAIPKSAKTSISVHMSKSPERAEALHLLMSLGPAGWSSASQPSPKKKM